MVIKHILTPTEKRCLERNRRIVRRRREGLNVAELACRFRLTPGSIYRILRAHRRATGENLGKLSRKPQQRPERGVRVLSPLEKRRLARNRRIVCLRREGHDVRELTRRYRLTPASIYRILQNHAHATGEYLGRQPRKPHHLCPNCDGPVFRRRPFCSRACFLAAGPRKWTAQAKQIIALRLEGRAWVETDAALGFRTHHVTKWLKENRNKFNLTESEWRRVFPGSGNYRR